MSRIRELLTGRSTRRDLLAGSTETAAAVLLAACSTQFHREGEVPKNIAEDFKLIANAKVRQWVRSDVVADRVVIDSVKGTAIEKYALGIIPVSKKYTLIGEAFIGREKELMVNVGQQYDLNDGIIYSLELEISPLAKDSEEIRDYIDTYTKGRQPSLAVFQSTASAVFNADGFEWKNLQYQGRLIPIGKKGEIVIYPSLIDSAIAIIGGL